MDYLIWDFKIDKGVYIDGTLMCPFAGQYELDKLGKGWTEFSYLCFYFARC